MDQKAQRLDIETLRRSVDELSTRNRLINLPPRGRGAHVEYTIDPRELRARMADGGWVRVDTIDPDSDDEGSRDRESVYRSLIRAATHIRQGLGIDGLMLGYGIAVWRAEHSDRRAPLVLQACELEECDGTCRLRAIGEAMLNPTLMRRLSLAEESFPADPLDVQGREDIQTGIVSVEPLCALGIFTPARLMLQDRLDPRRYDAQARQAVAIRLTQDAPSEPWPRGTPWAEGVITADLDASQARVVARTCSGESLAVEGPPGSGKTQIAVAVIGAAVRSQRSVLIISETSAALETLRLRLESAGIAHGQTLAIYGDHVRKLGSDTRGPSRLAELRDLSRAQRPKVVIATALSYMIHVPEEWTYDLTIVDEASQVALAHSLPALGAARQCLILGDRWQLRPSDLLTRSLDAIVSANTTPSLWDAVLRSGLALERATHHYRSLNPTLFHGANLVFYGNRLIVGPGGRQSGSQGLIVKRVNGLYDRASQTNPIEATAIVEQCQAALRTKPTGSLLVIALTSAQRDLIAVRLKRAEGDLIKAVTVVTPEQSQALEFDTVLVSLTYGPDRVGGKIPPALGHIALPESERLINVTMTRAREATILTASMQSDEIKRNQSRGQNALITFLQLAERRAHIPGKVYTGELNAIIAQCHCTGREHHNAIVLHDISGRGVGVLYRIGRSDERDERSEIQHLKAAGWKVAEIRDDQIAGVEGNSDLSGMIRSQISDFRTGL